MADHAFKTKMRKRFHEVNALVKKAQADIQPVRTKRDKMTSKLCDVRAEMKPLRDQIVKFNEGIAPLMAERASLSRALDGKVGPASGPKAS